MRIVRGEEDLVLADPLDHVREHLLFRLGREKPIAVDDVFAGLSFTQWRLELAPLLPLLVQPLHPVRNPSDSALEETNAQLGEPFRDPAVDQSGKLDESLHRPAKAVHVEKTVEALLSRRSLAPVVNTERNSQTLNLIIDRPEFFRSQVFFHSLRSDGNRHQP